MAESIRAVRTISALLLLTAGCRHQAPQPVAAAAPQRAASNQDSSARATALRDSVARADAARRQRARADSVRLANDAKAAAELDARRVITDPIHFAFDRMDLLATDRVLLERKTEVLQRNPTIQLRIEGNTDERGSDEYNIALGMRRAAAARQFLMQRGIDGARITMVSYGEERPLCQVPEEACWARNRRAEFVITKGGERLIASERP